MNPISLTIPRCEAICKGYGPAWHSKNRSPHRCNSTAMYELDGKKLCGRHTRLAQRAPAQAPPPAMSEAA